MTIVDVYSDNDTSAYSGASRPGYQRMLKAIAAGEVDVVIVWHTDRLYRRMADLEGYIDVCQPAAVSTLAVKAGPLDLTTPAGRMVARQLGAVAQYESEQKGERHRRANLQRAKQGRSPVTRRMFGYEEDGITLRPAEADALRDAYQAILDGSSIASICRRMNAAGLRTPQAGQEWTPAVLSITLRRVTRHAGITSYQGQILYGDDGRPVPSESEPIVDQATWHAAQAILRDPARSFPSKIRLLLSGVALCGVEGCGAVIQSGGSRNGRPRYRCSARGNHAYREAQPVDELVTAVVLERLARPDARQWLRPEPDPKVRAQALADLADIEQRSNGLVSAYAKGLLNDAQLEAGQLELAAQRRQVEGRLPQPQNRALRELAESSDPAEVWEALDTDERRRVINDLLVIRVMPTGGKEAAYLDWRKRIINPDTVKLAWKDPTMPPVEGPRRKRSVGSRPRGSGG